MSAGPMRDGQLEAGRGFRRGLKGLLASVVAVSGATIGLSSLAGAATSRPTTITLTVSPSSAANSSETPSS